MLKINKTISGRKRMSKLYQSLNPSYGTCECCGMPWSSVNGKVLHYDAMCGFFPICELCYYDEEISFEKLLTYYNRSDEHAFNSAQYEYIKQSLLKEAKIDERIKKKYEKHLMEIRENKINQIIKS